MSEKITPLNPNKETETEESKTNRTVPEVLVDALVSAQRMIEDATKHYNEEVDESEKVDESAYSKFGTISLLGTYKSLAELQGMILSLSESQQREIFGKFLFPELFDTEDSKD